MLYTLPTTSNDAMTTASANANSGFVFCPMGMGNGMTNAFPMAVGPWQMAMYAEAYRRAWELTEARKRAEGQARRASLRIGQEIVFSAGSRG